MEHDLSTDPRFHAAVDLLRRTGALSFQMRFQDDDEPVIWMALATYEMKDGQPVASGGEPGWEVDAGHSPVEAVLRLCARLVDGGTCVHCHKPTAFQEDLEPTFGDRMICWTQWDPELATFRRACE